MDNYKGYGVDNPIKVEKVRKRKVCFISMFVLALCFSLLFIACFNVANINLSVSNIVDVYADSYIYSQPDTWNTITWKDSDNNDIYIYGGYVWFDGINYYYSYGSDIQYVFDVSTSTWNSMIWNGTNAIAGVNIWTDGVNYYFSGSTNQYVLDVATSTWTAKTWNGLTDFYGSRIWTDGVNYYYSLNTNQYVLDVATSTWTAKTWNGLSSIDGMRVWSDGVNYYYSSGSSQYVLDVVTSTWTAKTWNGLSSFTGNNIWTDGVNYYFSDGSKQYVLDVATSTWTAKTWYGSLGSFSAGFHMFTLYDTVYYGSQNNGYVLVHDVIIPDVPSFTVSQNCIFAEIKFDDNLSSLSIYNDLVFTVSVSDVSIEDCSLFMTFTSSQLAYYGSFSNAFVFTIPFKYIVFEMYYSLDNTNSYSYNFTYNSFNFPTLDVYDYYSVNNGEHFGFQVYSMFYGPSVLTDYNFVSLPSLVGGYNSSTGIYDVSSLSLDVYNDSNFLFYSNSNASLYRGGSAGSCSLHSDVLDSSLLHDVSYRAQFRFLDIDLTYVYYYQFSNRATLVSGFVINYYSFLNSVNGTNLTSFSNWFNVPYSLTAPVLTYSSNYLSWTNVQGADYYSIYFDGNELVSNFVGNSYQITEYGDYYVVAYSNLLNVESAQSNIVTVSQTQLETPVLTLTYTVLSWTDVDNADYYVLYILDNDNYVIYASNITTTTYTLIASGTYKVRAVSRINLYQDSELSDSVSFVGVWTPDGSTGGNTFAGLIGAVIDVPVHYVISLFDFDLDFLGINMLNFILAMFTLCVIIFIIRFVLGRRPKD